MTGEMSKEEVTEENFPIHFAIAKNLGGEVHPFDHYQGPYIADLPNGGKLWLSSEDGAFGYVYNEKNDSRSGEFPLYPKVQADLYIWAIAAAREVI